MKPCPTQNNTIRFQDAKTSLFSTIGLVF